MHPANRTARVAGLLYLLLVILSFFIFLYVPTHYIVPGDSAATASKIIAGELIYRIGILSDIAGCILFIALVSNLYALFENVDKKYAVLMVTAVSVSVAFSLVNIINQIAPLVFLSGASFLSAFTKPQLDALALAFLRLRFAGFEVVAAFWGLWLFPFGMLVIRSRFLPKIVGILLIAASCAGLIHSFGFIVLPAYKQAIARVTVPVDAIGELSAAIWLLVKGATVPLPEARRSSLS